MRWRSSCTKPGARTTLGRRDTRVLGRRCHRGGYSAAEVIFLSRCAELRDRLDIEDQIRGRGALGYGDLRTGKRHIEVTARTPRDGKRSWRSKTSGAAGEIEGVMHAPLDAADRRELRAGSDQRKNRGRLLHRSYRRDEPRKQRDDDDQENRRHQCEPGLIMLDHGIFGTWVC